MGWKEYHRDIPVTPFAAHEDGYLEGLHHAQVRNDQFLDPNKPKTFALGGFHATNSSALDFLNLTEYVHPSQPTNPDKHIFIDRTKPPLAKFEIAREPGRVQADLTKLPFKESLDVVFLDNTLLFIAQQQFAELSESLATALTQQGIVLIINASRSHTKIVDTFISQFYKVKVEGRDDQDIIRGLAGHLKTIFHAKMRDYNVISLARRDSQYPEYQGKTYKVTY